MAKKASVKTADFSNVKDRGNFNPQQVEAGDYVAKVVKVEDAESKGGEFQYVFTIKLQKFSQYSYPYYCQLKENQLWKIRNLLIAAGLNVPKARMKLDPNKVVGRTIGVTMEDDEYEGKMKSVIAAIFPASELADAPADEPDEDEDEDEAEEADVADDDSDDEEEAPKAKKKKKAKDEVPADSGKKKKKKKSADVEELDLDDID